jgi:hypothetical protein
LWVFAMAYIIFTRGGDLVLLSFIGI